MAKEFMVTALHRYQQEEGLWLNVCSHLEGRRVYSTLDKAKAGLDAYLKKWNAKRTYNAKGERYETDAIGGGFAATTVMNKGIDYDLEVVAWRIKEREVTPWEEVESYTEA